MELQDPELPSDADYEDYASQPEDELLLGFIEEDAPIWSLQRQHFPSKIGGIPAWLEPVNIPRNEWSLCDFCHKPLTFLLQVYAPLDSQMSTFHRTIFVFVCQSQTCLNQHISNQNMDQPDFHFSSVKAFRGQLERRNPFYDFEPPEDPSCQPLTSAAVLCSWCSTWRGDKTCKQCHVASYCDKQHQVDHWRYSHSKLCRMATEKLDSSSSALTAGESNPCIWPELGMRVEADVAADLADLDKSPTKLDETMAAEQESSRNLLRDYQERIGKEGEYSEEELEGFLEEKLPEKLHWAEFQAIIAKAPSQVLRYSRGEDVRPLWPSLSGQPKVGDHPCKNCGSHSVFEFQVLPQILYFLKVDSTKEDSLDFGTIAIFTCFQSCEPRASCPKVSYVRENLWVQGSPV